MSATAMVMFGGGNPDGGTKLAYPLKCIIPPAEAGAVAGGAIPWKTGPFQLWGTASVVCAGQICGKGVAPVKAWLVRMQFQSN